MPVIALLTAVARAADCEDPRAAAAEAEAAWAEARLEDARAAWERADAALGCAPVAPEELARLLQLYAALLLARDGDPAGAGLALASARRLAPDLAPDFGSEVRALWDAAPPDGPAVELRPEPVPAGWTVRVDGADAPVPARVAPGLRLVQVVDPGGEVRWGELAVVTAPAPAVLPVPALGPWSPPAPPAPPAGGAARGGGATRIAGASLAVLGAVGLGAGAAAAGRIGDAPDLEALRRTRDAQVGFGAAGLALLAAGGVTVAVSFSR